jgi:hypothetical protein
VKRIQQAAVKAVRMNARLPDFLIIGAQRCGTTSIARWLGEHPQIFLGAKEVHFFDAGYERGTAWYAERFADAPSGSIAGEATPNYIFFPEVPARMAAVVPEARLVAILRNPVDRAYSHYWHERRRGREHLSFESALDAEPERTSRGDAFARARPAYLARGRYREQLERVTEHFPLSQLHVMLFDDVRAAPHRAYADLCRFLGVDAKFVPRSIGSRENASTAARSRLFHRVVSSGPALLARGLGRRNASVEGYPTMSPELRRRLLATMARSNAELEAWLGVDLSSWSR